MAIGASAANDTIFETLGLNGFFILDDQTITTGLTTANNGLPLATPCIRVVKSVASGAIVLPDLITNNTMGGFIAIINDSAVTITVFPFPTSSQTINGGASITIASGATGMFFCVPKQLRRGGYTVTGAGLDWRGASIS